MRAMHGTSHLVHGRFSRSRLQPQTGRSAIPVSEQVVERNLLLADWNDPDHSESLLSSRNARWGQEMHKNVRCARSPAPATLPAPPPAHESVLRGVVNACCMKAA